MQGGGAVSRRRAIILGAGPTGLVVGWQLAVHGWDVTVYEKADRVGGMCRSWRWGDFILDTGPHIFHTPDERLARFWEEHFGDLFVKGEFWCKNVRGEAFDEYWDYPLSWESLSRYPRALKETILREIESCSAEGRARARNFTEYVEAQVGPTLRRMFFEKYPRKIWGIPTDEMTPEWAPKRIEFRQKVTPFYHGQWNAVGRWGTGCIYERIRDRLLSLGGRVVLGTEVTGIAARGEVLTSITLADGKRVDLAPEDVVVSTLPIPLTARFLGHPCDLAFRGILSVYLAYDRPRILPEGIHWLYYDSEHVLFNRITEPKTMSPFVAPEGRTFLTCEITFGAGDATFRKDPEALMAEVAAQVERVGLAAAEDVRDRTFNVEPFVYPLQVRGYQESLARARAAIARHPRLYSLGTGGDFVYADSQILFHKAFDTVAVLCDRDSSFTQVIRRSAPARPAREASIDGRRIGPGAPAYIIAEAGLNHNGSLRMARRLIEAAREAGCDAIKFQTFQASSRVSRKVKAARYAETIIGTEETIYEMFDRLAFTEEQQAEIFDYARNLGVEIFSTPFDRESADLLDRLGVRVFKIASMDLVNLPLIRHVAAKGRPVILSCGMATLGQVEEALAAVAAEGNPQVMLLHCNSSYPAAPEEMNLRVIETLRRCFRVPVGLSDHTLGLFVAQTALARGAELIERHFTLDRTLEGPDHILSSEPGEMRELAAMARRIPVILGDGIKRIEPGEYAVINMQRKSLHAACDIRSGEVIREEMIAVKGPAGGILPRYLEMVVGRTARRDIEEDHPITWEAV